MRDERASSRTLNAPHAGPTPSSSHAHLRPTTCLKSLLAPSRKLISHFVGAFLYVDCVQHIDRPVLFCSKWILLIRTRRSFSLALRTA